MFGLSGLSDLLEPTGRERIVLIVQIACFVCMSVTSELVPLIVCREDFVRIPGVPWTREQQNFRTFTALGLTVCNSSNSGSKRAPSKGRPIGAKYLDLAHTATPRSDFF